ncbi:uncharacterized protein ACNLHF_008569 [Anomaloglossus baeobatrachus]
MWPEKLPDLVDMYNNIPVSSTNCTPAYLMRARPGKLPVDLEMGIVIPKTSSPEADWDTKRQEQYKKVQECVERSLNQIRERQEKDYNKNAPAAPLIPGEIFLKRKRRTHKLDDQWEAEPYTVLPSNFDNKKMCLISKDKGKTSVAVSRDHLKKCPEQLKPKEVIPCTPQPKEEKKEKMIRTVLGDFPESWPKYNGTIIIPLLTTAQPVEVPERLEEPVEVSEELPVAVEPENPAIGEPASPMVNP